MCAYVRVRVCCVRAGGVWLLCIICVLRVCAFLTSPCSRCDHSQVLPGFRSDGGRPAGPARLASVCCYRNELLHPGRGQCTQHCPALERPTRVVTASYCPLHSLPMHSETCVRHTCVAHNAPGILMPKIEGKLMPIREDPSCCSLRQPAYTDARCTR